MDEITFGYTKGTNLSYGAYEPDGTVRTAAGTALPEEGATGYFHADDADVVPGDFIIITNDDLSDRVVGYGTFGMIAAEGNSSKVTSAGYVGDYVEDEIVYFFWYTTVAPTTDGTIKVYKNDGTTEVTAPTGITDTRDFDGKTGVHLCSVNIGVINSFYAKKKDYVVVLTGAVIDGETTNAVIASFSIEQRYAGLDFDKSH